MEESRDHHCFIRRLFWTSYFYREIKGNLIWLAIKGTICFRFFVVKYLHDDCFAIKSWFEVLMWLMVYSIIINIALGYLSVWHLTKKNFFVHMTDPLSSLHCVLMVGLWWLIARSLSGTKQDGPEFISLSEYPVGVEASLITMTSYLQSLVSCVWEQDSCHSYLRRTLSCVDIIPSLSRRNSVMSPIPCQTSTYVDQT